MLLQTLPCAGFDQMRQPCLQPIYARCNRLKSLSPSTASYTSTGGCHRARSNTSQARRESWLVLVQTEGPGLRGESGWGETAPPPVFMASICLSPPRPLAYADTQYHLG
jgi:hypothetical protein